MFSSLFRLLDSPHHSFAFRTVKPRRLSSGILLTVVRNMLWKVWCAVSVYRTILIRWSTYVLRLYRDLKNPEESVEQNKSTRSRKPELSTMDRSHQMDGWPFRVRLCASPEISSESNSVQTLQKSFGWDYKSKPPMCIGMQKDHIRMLKIL